MKASREGQTVETEAKQKQSKNQIRPKGWQPSGCPALNQQVQQGNDREAGRGKCFNSNTAKGGCWPREMG
jgi:hypothetical protein